MEHQPITQPTRARGENVSTNAVTLGQQVSRVQWFRRQPVGGTVFVRPAENPVTPAS